MVKVIHSLFLLVLLPLVEGKRLLECLSSSQRLFFVGFATLLVLFEQFTIHPFVADCLWNRFSLKPVIHDLLLLSLSVLFILQESHLSDS